MKSKRPKDRKFVSTSNEFSFGSKPQPSGLDPDRLLPILLEVCLNKQPDRDDTPEEARYRAQLVREVDAIRAGGFGVDIPSEIPSPD